MKTCQKCGERKALTEFHKYKHSADGRQRWCRACKHIERKTRYEKNRDHDRACERMWAKENKDRRNAMSARRRARKKQAELQWTTAAQKEAIDAKYALRDVYTKEKGEEYHVDHIWPLKGFPTVFEDFDEKNIDFDLMREDMLLLWENSFRGLHVAHNLEVIPASDNLSKSNKRPVDEDGNERPACKWSKTEYDY